MHKKDVLSAINELLGVSTSDWAISYDNRIIEKKAKNSRKMVNNLISSFLSLSS